MVSIAFQSGAWPIQGGCLSLNRSDPPVGTGKTVFSVHMLCAQRRESRPAVGDRQSPSRVNIFSGDEVLWLH